MFDERGGLESMNENAEFWLDEIPETAITPWMTPVGEEERSPRGFGVDILTVSSRARAIAAELDGGTAQARIQGGGRWLVLLAFHLRNGVGYDGRTALVIQPARGSEIAPIMIQAYELTPREQQLTELLSYGLATGEISKQLAYHRARCATT